MCRSAINDAKDLRFEEPPGWLESAFDSAVDWIADHADILKAIADILNQVSMIAGMLSFIPGMAALALITGAAALLINVAVMAATGEWDVASLVMDAAGLIPGVKALKGAGEVADGAKVATNVAEEGAEAIAKNADEVAESAVRNVDAPSPSSASKTSTSPADSCTAGEPVDLITGEMILEQIDLELPGTLPLRIVRTHRSNLRWGRRFGRSWGSTFDQKLIADVEGGAALITDDGSVLHFPHGWTLPVGASVRPTHGKRRWILTRRPDGGFEVVDPLARVTRIFTAPDAGGTAVIRQVADPFGNHYDFGYDDAGSVTEIVHSGGYLVRLDSEDDVITALSVVDRATDAVTTVRRFGYNGLGELVGVVNASEMELNYAYDDAGRMVNWVDRNGMWYSYTYDGSGRCTRMTGMTDVLNCILDYLPGRTVLIDSLSGTMVFEYNELCQVTRTVDQLGGVRSTAFDQFHRLLTDVDALGRTTRYTWDINGALLSRVDPDGLGVTMTRDPWSLPVGLSRPDGATWTWEYDAVGCRRAAVDPAGARTEYRNIAGAVVEMRDALGGLVRVDRDRAGSTIAVTDQVGARWTRELDAFGRPVRIVDPVGAVTRYEWTAEGRPARVTLPDGSDQIWWWDAEGNLAAHTDEIGATTSYVNDFWDRPTVRLDPDGARYRFAYDTELHLVGVTNPVGDTWRYEYDARGELVAETDFSGRRLEYRRDRAGQVIRVVTADGSEIDAEYDVRGNRTSLRTPEGEHRFGYDPQGRLITATSPGVAIRLERDLLGHVVAEEVDGRRITSTRNALGQRISRTLPSGVSTGWDHNAAHDVVGMVSGGRQISFSRDGLGRETGRSFEGGLSISIGRDLMGDLRSITGGGPAGAPLVDRRYDYRADGALQWETDRVAGRERHYELDRMGRIVQVDRRRIGLGPDSGVVAPTAESWSERYAYTVTGSVSAAIAGSDTGGTAPADLAGTGRREYAGTRVTRVGNTRYGWDRDGRLTTRSRVRPSSAPEVTRFRYDSLDRLVEVAVADGTRWLYRYDAFGRRIAKTHLGADDALLDHVVFTWDGDRLVEEARLTPVGPVVRTWEYGSDPFRPIAQHDIDPGRAANAAFHAVITDLVGTPTELVTADGREIVWTATDQTIWGAPVQPASAAGRRLSCPLAFPGQYRDDETGLNYNRYRYYDPESGRYTTADPLGLTPAPDPHSYVRNPTRTVDPYGLHEVGNASATGRPGPGDPLDQQPPLTDDSVVVRGGASDMPGPGEEFSGAYGRDLPRLVRVSRTARSGRRRQARSETAAAASMSRPNRPGVAT